MNEEINHLIDENMLKQGENFCDHFEENRQIGQNESYICKLIREDSVEEFIEYVNRFNIQLSKEIEKSIFETNTYLLENNPTIIEYAAFFGSIEIFQYLRFNNIEINEKIWLYAIHGRNPEIIHLLEELHIVPIGGYELCLKESIKCHHNELASYFEDNYNLSEKIKHHYSIKYYNYSLFPENLYDIDSISYLVQYGYFEFVNILLKTSRININEKVKISNFVIFNRKNKILKKNLIFFYLILIL